MSTENQSSKICFVSMPFVEITYPTLAIPLLQSVLKEKGIKSSSRYYAEFFKNICSQEIYNKILQDSCDNELGDWFFSRKTFQLNNDNYLDLNYAKIKDKFLRIRNKFEKAIDIISNENWEIFDIIGFSCTFLQLMPSLCLAKLIKVSYPNIEIIFGGGNMLPEVSKQIIKNCLWIDKIFVGESEKSLVHYLKYGNTNIEGIMWRDNCNIKFSGQSKLTIKEIQNLPIPNYDDYYKTTSEKRKLSIQIGRGCLYNKCNFCVFVDHTNYRKGSINNVIKQLKYLIDKYGIKDVYFVDLILPPNVFKNLPTITGEYTFCISSFTWSYDHLQYLKNNNVCFGIESFHPEILKLLNKKQSIIKCISILKWLKYYNVNVIYLILFGAIGEMAQWYDEMLSLMKHLTHLPPPIACQPISHHRNSTYLQKYTFKISSVYSQIYPSQFNLNKMARIFEIDDINIYMKQILNWKHIKSIKKFCKSWKYNYYTKSTFLRRIGNVVLDNRYNKTIKHILTNNQIKILETCNYPTKHVNINNQNNDIEFLLKSHLLLNMEKQYLNLVEPIQTES